TTALRTSSDAWRTTSKISRARVEIEEEEEAGEEASAFFVVWYSRKRGKIFSTSMVESSTTSPSAIRKPPSVIVFRVMPNFCSTITAVSKDNGMADSEIKAVRTLNNSRHKTTATRMPPSSIECLILLSAVSINVAGRWRCG